MCIRDRLSCQDNIKIENVNNKLSFCMAFKTLNKRNKKDLKWPKIIIAILSTIGIVDTGSISLKNWGLFTSLSCPGIQNGCETVLNSPWGTLFKNNQVNIPLSLAGFITYLSIKS